MLPGPFDPSNHKGLQPQNKQLLTAAQKVSAKWSKFSSTSTLISTWILTISNNKIFTLKSYRIEHIKALNQVEDMIHNWAYMYTQIQVEICTLRERERWVLGIGDIGEEGESECGSIDL